MNFETAKKFLYLLGAESVQNAGAWARCSCPLAPWKHGSGKDARPSFGVKIEPVKRSFYNCFSCNSGGYLDDLLVELMHLNKDGQVPMDIADAFKLTQKEAELGFVPSKWEEFTVVEGMAVLWPWPEWWLSSFVKAKLATVAKDYLESRGVAGVLLDDFDIRYDTLRNAVSFPFRSEAGALAGMRGRYLKPVGDLRYHDYDYNGVSNTSVVWFNEHRVDWSKTVVLAEGAFDVVGIHRQYRNVISPLSAGMSVSKMDRLKQAVKIVCFFDNDEAGERAYWKVRKYVGKSTSVKKVTYPATAKPGEDASSLQTGEVGEMLAHHVKVAPLSCCFN